MTVIIVGLLVLAVIVAIRSYPFLKQHIPANSSDWVILEWHKALTIDESGNSSWVSGAPVHIQFVPIIGWEYIDGKILPITPSVYDLSGRLNKVILDNDNENEYETAGYWIRDGAVYDLPDMKPVDFWTDLFNHAFGRTKIEVHGTVPDSYRKRLFDIVSLSEKEDLDFKNP